MTLVWKSLFFVLLAGALAAQTQLTTPRPSSAAEIDGIVIKEPGSEPVKKAVIELIAEGDAGGNYTAVSGVDGRFRVEGILPGRYRLFVERTGMLEAEKHHVRGEGRVLTLSAGQTVSDLAVHLQAAAVVAGRVVDEDGDPLPNAQVTVMRQSFASGHSRWEQVGGERTNDLGEYRIANLPAGSYYVSVSPPPDFKSLIEGAGAQKPQGASEADKPATSYQATYYPGTTDRGQATPVQLHPGDEFPINFSLTPSPSLMIRGSVVGLPPHTSASIMLQSRDFNLVLSGAEVMKDGSFAFHDVSPGAYTIVATVENASTPMMARQMLQVANSVDGLRLAPQPGAWIRGRFLLEGKSGGGRVNPDAIVLLLRATDGDDNLTGSFFPGDGFSPVTRVGMDGAFEWKSVPPGNYYVELAEGSGGVEDLYLKSVSAGGRDQNASGIAVNGGSMMLDVVASANAGSAEGSAVNSNGEPVANAVIVAVPEPRLRGRDELFRRTASDQAGRFTLRGMAPGDYTVFAWEGLDGEPYLNPDFLKSVEGQGVAVRIREGERGSLQVKVIADAGEGH